MEVDAAAVDAAAAETVPQTAEVEDDLDAAAHPVAGLMSKQAFGFGDCQVRSSVVSCVVTCHFVFINQLLV